MCESTGKNLVPLIFGPFWSKFAPFWPQINIFAPLNGMSNFADFWYRNLSYGLLLENSGLRFCKNLAPPISGPFWSKFSSFRPKIYILVYIFQTVHWILLIFGIETFLMVFFQKIEVYSLGKFWPRPFWALFGPNLPLFGPKSTFWLISSEGYVKFCWFLV